jgi:hypothetical protein
MVPTLAFIDKVFIKDSKQLPAPQIGRKACVLGFGQAVEAMHGKGVYLKSLCTPRP